MDKGVAGILAVVAALAGGHAGAQQPAFDVSAGVKAWKAEWTTFTYNQNDELLQVPAESKVVLIPVVSGRYGNFVGSFSGYKATRFRFMGSGEQGERKEWDINAGYLVAPAVAVTIGYKKYSQLDLTDDRLYEVAGPTLGVSATAPIRDAVSMYGSFALGRLKNTGRSNVFFDNDYHLTDVGVAWTLPLGGTPRALTFTLGYRIQVLTSKEATTTQDARDYTQGFSLGVLASF